MKILGIDPSLASTGVVVWDDLQQKFPVMETICTEKGSPYTLFPDFDDLDRALCINFNLRTLIEEYQPDLCCVEISSGAKDASAAKALGMATGLMGHVADRFMDFYPVKPTWVKKYTVGTAASRAAETPSEKKRLIIDWAEERHPDAPWVRDKWGKVRANQEHVADAIAIIHTAILYYEPSNYKMIFRRPSG